MKMLKKQKLHAKRQEIYIYFNDLNASYNRIIPIATKILKLA